MKPGTTRIMLRRIALALSFAVILATRATRADTPAEWGARHVDELIKIYRQFHEHPELSSQEEQTAARIAELWQSAGAEVHRRIGGHGVVGIIKNGPGPTVMLRTDLDALAGC